MRNLVLARVGSRSLHSEWRLPGRSRDWDLRLLPYEPIGPQPSDIAVKEVVPGPKWSGLHGRRVGFVEIMCPAFSRTALERLLFTLELSETGWGWGLDSVWPMLLDYRNVGVLDGVTVTHTRPVGAMRDPDLRRRVHAESDSLLATFDCDEVHVTFRGFDSRFEPLDRSAEDLVAD